MDDKIDFIQNHISYAALCEQLAEEATELAQEALKLARIIRDENPTNAQRQKTWERLENEFSDVGVCAKMLDLEFNDAYMEYKINRWEGRIKAHQTKESE